MPSSNWKLNQTDLALIDLALAEDLNVPFNDITTTTLFSEAKNTTRARIISKNAEPIVICGIPVVEAILAKLDTPYHIHSDFCDGQILAADATLITITGPAHNLLMVERTLLNFLQRLCAISTLTARYVNVIKHTTTKILDTRKTTPGFRHLEKYAVHCGGGVNHRMGLYDAIMIKDTHIDSLGGMVNALHALPDDITQKYPVIVEVRTIDELNVVLEQGRHKITRVLLDNMPLKIMSECIHLCKNKIATEASGNMDINTVLPVAECGVDFISVGKITHSATTVDLSMKCSLAADH